MPNTAEILITLPRLPAADLQQIEQRCKALRCALGGSLPVVQGPALEVELADSDSELMLRAVSTQLRRLGAEFASVPVLRKAATADFRAKAAGVMEFVRHGGVTNRVEQAAVVAEGRGCCAGNMFESRVMVSAAPRPPPARRRNRPTLSMRRWHSLWVGANPWEKMARVPHYLHSPPR